MIDCHYHRFATDLAPAPLLDSAAYLVQALGKTQFNPDSMVDDEPHAFLDHFRARSSVLAVAVSSFDDQVVISTASLKFLSRASSRSLMRKSGLFWSWLLQDCPSVIELGYLVTLREHRHRGYGLALCSFLLATVESYPVYATVHSKNVGVVALLRKLCFIPVGEPWTSVDGTDEVCLYLRPRLT